MKCRTTNTCPVCGMQEPCAAIHLSSAMRTTQRHRDGLCYECVRWIIRRRDALMREIGVGPTAAERQAKTELRRAQRDLEPRDFRSYRSEDRRANP